MISKVASRRSSWALSALLLLLDCASVGAQENSGDMLAEVIVTAAKRSEPLQKVPEAVSALSADSIQQMGASSFVDYARAIPSLTFTDSGNGREKPSLRGINASAGSDTVGYYIGETPIESIYLGSAINPDLIDLDHVEVLRGPQGTLYGGESIGGTIKLIPNAPNLSKVEGEVQGSGLVTQTAHGHAPGGYGDLVLNVPIVEGVAAVRGVFWGRDVDGFIDRTYGYTGNFGNDPHSIGTVKNIPVEHTWGFRGSALVRPIDNLDISAMVYLQDQRFNGFQDITGGATNPNNGLQQNLISDVPEPQRNRFALYSLTANYAFGRFSLVSNTSYSENRFEVAEEGTSGLQLYLDSPAFPTAVEEAYTNYGITQETRIATTERVFGFDGVLGVFYSHSHNYGGLHWSPPEYNSVVAGNDPSSPLYAPDNDLFNSNGGGFARQTAEFGEASYHITEALTATVGLRHYLASDGTDSVTSGYFFNGSNIPQSAETRASSSGWAHKGNLSYQLTENHMVYAQYTEGFRPGFGAPFVPNLCNAPPVVHQVNPDSIKNYELGAKTAWLEKRLTVNVALYRINWSDIQQQALLPCGYFYATNFGDAVVKGVEFEINHRMTNRVSVGLSGSYTQAKLKQDILVAGVVGALAGDQIEGVPNWQYAVYTMATYPILQINDGYTRLDFQYTGSSPGDYSHLADGSRDPASELQVTRLFNLRTGLKYGSFDFSLSATNLLNTISRQSIDPNASVAFAIPGRPRFVVNRPRTFLINAIYKF